MDVRADTSSGRFGGQWAYLNHTVEHGNINAHSRSLPPSSYLPRTDTSNGFAPPVSSPLYHFNNPRTSLLQTKPTASVGGQSSVTLPSQPVLVREHSADASTHSRPSPSIRIRRPDPNMSRNNELPPLSAFSMAAIIEETSEENAADIDALSEILGRSHFTLASQHDSHLPPQGEIIANDRLQTVLEESTSDFPFMDPSTNNLRLPGDTILIANDDFSVIDGRSHADSSAAYGLLERLQAVARRQHDELPVVGPSYAPLSTYHPIYPNLLPSRTQSSPAMLADPTAEFVDAQAHRRSSRSSRMLLGNPSSNPAPTAPSSGPVVSEIYLSAGAHGRPAADPPLVSEGGRHYLLYSYDESEIFESVMPDPSPKKGSLGLISWLTGVSGSGDVSAEGRLRDILLKEGEGSAAGGRTGDGVREVERPLPEGEVPDTEEELGEERFMINRVNEWMNE